jgi:hypothetical protein
MERGRCKEKKKGPSSPQSSEGYSSHTVIDFEGSDALPLLSYQEGEKKEAATK